MLLLLKGVTGFLPVAYALVFSLYFSFLYGERRPGLERVGTVSLFVLLLVHLGTLFLRGLVLDHCPLVTAFEVVSFLALAIAATHLMVECVTGDRTPGIPALGLAVLLQTAASSYLGYESGAPEIMREWLVPLHAVFGICGHAAFLTAAGYSSLYLVLYRQIKRHRLDHMWRRLPPLEKMHRMSFWAVGIGVTFLSLAIGTGWGRAASRGWPPAPLISSGVSWLAFGSLLGASRLRRFGGKKFSVLTLLATALDLLTLFFSEWFHRGFVEG